MPREMTVEEQERRDVAISVFAERNASPGGDPIREESQRDGARTGRGSGTSVGRPKCRNIRCTTDVCSISAMAHQVVDPGTMATSGCVTADINADGRPDMVCIGSCTANIKWYENVAADSPNSH
jgi:hypothetical protein